MISYCRLAWPSRPPWSHWIITAPLEAALATARSGLKADKASRITSTSLRLAIW